MRAYEEMCGEQGFKAVDKTVHWVAFIGKGCFFFRVLLLRYLQYLQDIKDCDSYSIYLVAQ